MFNNRKEIQRLTQRIDNQRDIIELLLKHLELEAVVKRHDEIVLPRDISKDGRTMRSTWYSTHPAITLRSSVSTEQGIIKK